MRENSTIEQEEQIDISALSAGVYFMQLKTKDAIGIVRFVKQ